MSYVFDGSTWTEVDFEATDGAAGTAMLWVRIYDIDIVEVVYEPAGLGTGRAYLRYTPRISLEDDNASAHTDPDREAAGLAS